MNRFLLKALDQGGDIGAPPVPVKALGNDSTITTSSCSVWPSGAVQTPFAGDRR